MFKYKYRAAMIVLCAFSFQCSTEEPAGYNFIEIVHKRDGTAKARNRHDHNSPLLGKQILCPVVMQLPVKNKILCKRIHNHLYINNDLSYVEYVANANAFAILNGRMLIENPGFPEPKIQIEYARGRKIKTVVKGNANELYYGLFIQKKSKYVFAYRICGKFVSRAECNMQNWLSIESLPQIDLTHDVPIIHYFEK